MSAPSRARCPHCRKTVETAADRRPKDYPFCSERCRLLDLHKWLNGDYSIPAAAPSPHDLREE
ncbi:MAG: DNA gyrase inhibitor YacG [Planctomycetota bacterium]